MQRYITLLAATLATVQAGSYGGSSQYGSSSGMSSDNMQSNDMQSNDMSSGQQQYGSSGSSQYGSQQMSSSSMNWMGMSQSSNSQQMGVVIISTNAGGSNNWQMVSQNSNMYMQNSSPQTHQVTVGAGLTYSPNSVMAAPGDYIQFNFYAQNHTVTQSAFDKPCVKMAGGMDSGFMANMNNMTQPPPAMKMQVMSTMPTWFYCRQMGHCGKGMVFSVNPSAEKTQSMFTQMAMQQNGTSSSMAPPSPPAAVSSPQTSVVQGNGQDTNGQCSCQCLCGTNAYAPNLGVGMMGGLSGMIPMSPAPSA